MARIGITGHQDLAQRLETQGASHSDEEAWAWVEEAFGEMLSTMDIAETTLVSCLATGADQHLSRIGFARGARLSVVVPSRGYDTTFAEPDTRRDYNHLFNAASEVVHLDFPEPSELAFYAGGKCVVDQSDRVVAVWDGRDAVGLGGTGDIVVYAREHGRDVLHIDPIHRAVFQLSGKE